MAEPKAGLMVTSNVRLLRLLGEGGMGSVWVAEHLALHTNVVVKFISAEFATNEDALDRFSREAAAASQVKSPHVVQTLDHGVTPDGIPYIVMEHLEGHDLEKHLERGPMDTKEVVEIVSQLARALEKAHGVGIVHRDIKPSNVFLCDAGDGGLFVKLLDFGIAKGANMPKLDSGTKTGAMMGSPYYMSPEQVVGARDIDHRTDLWSVGVVVFEALTGSRPFDAETVGALAIMIHSKPLPVPSRLDARLPAAFDSWFQHACARPPGDRFSSARELSDQLVAALTGEIPASVAFSAPGRVSAKDSFANAKTTVDAGLHTDARLGLQTSSRGAGNTKTVRGALVGGALVAVCFGLAFVGVRQIRKEPDTSTRSGLVLPADGASAAPPASAGIAAKTPDPIATQIAPSASVTAGVRALTVLTGKRPPKVDPSAKPSATAAPAAPRIKTPDLPPSNTGHDIF